MNYLANKTIVVPFDFSDVSHEAVETAISMADKSTKIHLIHVIEPTPVLISLDPALPVPPALDEGRKEFAQGQLQETEFADEKNIGFRRHCVIGEPGTEIVNFAKSFHADLIIMPSHGRTGLSRFLLGSVAERVLRLSHCPVLILRHDVGK